jgi:hypothetical protein
MVDRKLLGRGGYSDKPLSQQHGNRDSAAVHG